MLRLYNCYFPGEDPLFIQVMFEVYSRTVVKTLLKAVAAELKEEGRTDLKIKDLRLFKVNFFFFLSFGKQLQ